MNIIKKFYNELINSIKEIIAKSKKRSSKLQDFFFGGINAIKEGMNNINKNIKQKIKGNNDNNEQKEIRSEGNSNNIKENLNEILSKRQQQNGEIEKQKKTGESQFFCFSKA